MSDETPAAPPAPPNRRAMLLTAKGLPPDSQPYISIEVFVQDEGDPVTLILENETPGEPSGAKPLQLAALIAASNLIEEVQGQVEKALLTRLLVQDRERRAAVARAKRAVEEELEGAVPYVPERRH